MADGRNEDFTGDFFRGSSGWGNRLRGRESRSRFCRWNIGLSKRWSNARISRRLGGRLGGFNRCSRSSDTEETNEQKNYKKIALFLISIIGDFL